MANRKGRRVGRIFSVVLTIFSVTASPHMSTDCTYHVAAYFPFQISFLSMILNCIARMLFVDLRYERPLRRQTGQKWSFTLSSPGVGKAAAFALEVLGRNVTLEG